VPAPVRLCFVCLGNICRSPTAEGVMRRLVDEAGLADRIEVDSAGTAGYHVGDPPDRRALAEAGRRGTVLESVGRQLGVADLERFDLLVVMDRSNLADARRLARGTDAADRIRLLREFDPEAGDDLEVPDPYYGGADGFAAVYDVVERSCRGLLDHLRSERLVG
jgi:protein-tyrosine phosphatase